MPTSKKDVAYEHIRRNIAYGSYRPGQRLTLARVAEELGMSTLPVREALMQLAHERMVVITPHVGAVVALADLPQILEVIETLAILEGHATAAARKSSDLDGLVAELRITNDSMKRHRQDEDWEALTRANRGFHHAIYAANPNRTLFESIERLWERLDVLLGASPFSFVPSRTGGSIQDHETIIAMLSDPAVEPLDLEVFARGHKRRTAESLKDQADRHQSEARRPKEDLA